VPQIAGVHVGPARGDSPVTLLSYKVLALKYRPSTFDEVVGQTTVTRTLRNAIEQDRIGHAFLLSGARGVGKTTTARILAKALNCSRSEGPTPDPCGECDSCREIADGKALDVQEIDGASNNSVDQVRELRESARYNPARDRFKIWIIDEVHMLSTGAFNALLKTLEEPPPRVKFIFATTEYHKIPETILSRCQQYDFRMIPARELQGHLRRIAARVGITGGDAALAQIARAAEGSVRDALSLFDQVLAFTGEEVKDEEVGGLLGLVDRELLYRASAAVGSGDSLAVLELVESLADYGADYRNFARELLLHLREILLVKLAPEASALLGAILPEERMRLGERAEAFSEEDLLRGVDLLTRAEGELRHSPDPRVALELALLKLVQMRRLLPFSELVAKVERLAGGTPVPGASRSATRVEVPARAASRPTSTRRPSAGAAPTSPSPSPGPDEAEEPAEAPPPNDPGAALLVKIRALCETRPTLAQPLRGARALLEGKTLTLTVSPAFVTMASMHVDEYKELARKAAGHALGVVFEAGVAPEEEPPAPPSQEEVRRKRLREEAEREPAVQEALDLFDGRVVDVKEAKPSREDA
jgi:DNA polymerase-3 subunit gamma/tau